MPFCSAGATTHCPGISPGTVEQYPGNASPLPSYIIPKGITGGIQYPVWHCECQMRCRCNAHFQTVPEYSSHK